MTREEEEARLAEIEAMPRVSARAKTSFREYMERRWALADAGVADFIAYRTKRLLDGTL